MEISVFSILDTLGTLAFAISGATLAIKKRFDLFGVFVLAFVTAIGGGTLRDVLIGDTPVEWMGNNALIITIIVGAVSAIILNPYMNRLSYFVYLFDAAGLGLFTMAGIQKGLEHDYSIFMCISLGTISATFGGLIRDLITGDKPMLLTRKEIYALAGASGGLLFFILRAFSVPEEINIPLTIVVIFLIRHLTYRFGIKLPTYDEENGWSVKD
ncbi:MAG: trimeric intracellular cation channel family protein [Flavobacteriales bacterium]|nr:trimeric intracellular cation channel family protein [Flavobacteriales bacterium]